MTIYRGETVESVGTGCVITKDVPGFVVVAGCPVRTLKKTGVSGKVGRDDEVVFSVRRPVRTFDYRPPCILNEETRRASTLIHAHTKGIQVDKS